MFKINSRFISNKEFEDGFFSDEIYNESYFKNKPISIFNDYVPTQEELEYNEYNILMIMEPNGYFGLHDWALQNGHKFDCIFTWSEQILNKFSHALLISSALSWLPKESIERISGNKKQFEVSFVCGGKRMLKGHEIRHNLYKRENEILIPKKWFYTLDDYDYNGGHHTITKFSNKEIAWENSMFSVCIENSSVPNYYTEKLIDAFLTKTVPIYWGCTNLETLGYDSNGYIICNDDTDFIKTINSLSESDYLNRMESIEHNFKLANYYYDFFGNLRKIIVNIIDINNITR